MTDTAVKDDNNENEDKHAECMTISWVEIDEKNDKIKRDKKYPKICKKVKSRQTHTNR